MSRSILVILFALVTELCFSQDGFKPGYIIDNQGTKKECWILIEEKAVNPRRVVYKNSPDGSQLVAEIDEVAEFGIEKLIKFKRAEVDIDRSTTNVTKIWTNGAEPEFTNEVLFLRVLIESRASLYIYKQNDLTKYFFDTPTSPVKQLLFRIHKGFENEIVENNEFRQQLWKEVRCETTTLADIRKVEYSNKSLISYFEEYAECSKAPYTNFAEKPVFGKPADNQTVKLRVLAGATNSSIYIYHRRFDIDQDLSSEVNIMIGTELEFMLPFTNKNWSAIFQPNLRSFESTADLRGEVAVKYTSLSTAIGLRRYFNLSNSSKIFLSGYVVADVPTTENIDVNFLLNGLTYSTDISFMFGLGGSIGEKISIEAKYFLQRDLLSSFAEWTAEYNSVSLQVGYRIF